MPTEEQIQAWEQAGEPIRQQRRAMREKHGGGGRAADEVRRLREAAAKSATVCADCFAPLAPDASVTLTSRFIEHIPAHYHPVVGVYIKARDIFLPVPICLPCWLIAIVERDQWLCRHLRGVRQNQPLDRAGPLSDEARWKEAIRRFR